MKKLLMAGALALAAVSAHASEVTKVLIVHDATKDPVRMDYRSNAVAVEVLDLSFGSSLDERMTSAVTAGMQFPTNLTEVDESQFEAEVNERFSRFAQTDEYRQMQREMMEWGEKVAQLASFQITQAPAIVINDSFIVYGERSVNEAIETYYSQVN